MPLDNKLQVVLLTLSFTPGIDVTEAGNEVIVDLRDGRYRVRYDADPNQYVIIYPSRTPGRNNSLISSEPKTVATFFFERNTALLWEAISRWLIGSTSADNKSARAMLAYLISAGSDAMEGAHPEDLDDLRACLDFLHAFPEFDAKRHVLGGIDPVWNEIMARWDDLLGLYAEELKDGKHAAPLTYDMLKRAIGDGYKKHTHFEVRLNERGHVLCLSKREHDEAAT